MLVAFYILVAVAVLVIGYEIVRIARRIGIAKELGREAALFSYEDAAAEKRILIIGDSTSYGTGTADSRHSLAGRLSADFKDHAVENHSENAMSLARLVEKLNSIEGSYDRVFIHTGGVDTMTMTPLPKVRAQVTEALTRATALSRGPVYLVSVNNTGAVPAFRYPFSRLFSNRSQQVSQVCDEVCRALNARHIPLWQPATEDELALNGRDFFARDGMHPNDRGYGIWYARVKQSL